MLAGCKLLLADDSTTIQKVVALTFADEGVEVVTVSDGKEAIAILAEVLPDVVLADVFMPEASGYEVCEYVKQDAKLKHIPVMLLVGSFEPFDEAEARRVGADEILTKPFQSIRRLIDKVSGLVSGKAPIEDAPTAEYPKAEAVPSESANLKAAELEITTADTQPLHVGEQHLAQSQSRHDLTVPPAEVQINRPNETMENTMMQSNTSEVQHETALEGDVLMDLGDIGPQSNVGIDDFVLDIDVSDLPQSHRAEVGAYNPQTVLAESELAEAAVKSWKFEAETTEAVTPTRVIDDDVAPTGELNKDWAENAKPEKREAGDGDFYHTQPVVLPSQQVAPDQLSPETIDAIARRVVERLSEKVVREIAWEVVPQLAELMIKRQLEEKESQAK